MILTVYADATGLFTEEECDIENLCEIEVPEQIILDYYRTYKTYCDADCLVEGFSPSFHNWYYEVYTANITDDFLNFAAVKYNYKPVLAG